MKIDEDAYAITQIFFTISKFFVLISILGLIGFFFTHPSMSKQVELKKEKEVNSIKLLKIKKELKKLELRANKEKAYINRNKFNIKAYKKSVTKDFLDLYNSVTPTVKLTIKEIKLSEKYHNVAIVKLNIIYADPEQKEVEQGIVKKIVDFLGVDSLRIDVFRKGKGIDAPPIVKIEGKNQEVASYTVYAVKKN